MFVSVKSLTALIDQRMQYVSEAYENRDNFDEETFASYIKEMKSTLVGNLEKLESISCNKKLIEKYSKKIDEVFQ